MRPLDLDPATCLIGGQWAGCASGKTIDLLNPSTGEVLCAIARGGAVDIDHAVRAAQSALAGPWGRFTATERGQLLYRLSDLVHENADQLARIEAMDLGKPLRQARADVMALAGYMEFYAGAADKMNGTKIPDLDGYTVYTLREPHGVTGHIIPWNYPMQIVGRSVGAALAMGNACVLKPSEVACLTVLAFGELARRAGFPDGAVNIVPGLGAEAGAALSAHPGVQHLRFTGSPGVGRLVQQAAGRNVVPVTLELGGKSPQIIFDDADLDTALPFLVKAGLQNAGQTCTAGSRILVQRAIHDDVVARMSHRYRSLKVGPAIDDLDMGPLISARQKDIVESYILEGKDLTVAAQGSITARALSQGFYIAPTLFGGVPADHVLAQTEIFGPVQVIIPFDDEAEALAMANGASHGLVASVWTRDAARQMRLARALRSGQVFLNTYGAGGGVEVAFGSAGLSGHGREKGLEALYGFSTLKTVAALQE